MIVVTREKPDLDVTAAFAEAADRACGCGRTSKGIDRHVGAATGQLTDPVEDFLGLACVDQRGRAYFLGKIERLGVDVNSDDLGPEGAGDHDGGQTDATAAVHGDPLTG